MISGDVTIQISKNTCIWIWQVEDEIAEVVLEKSSISSFAQYSSA